MEEQEFREKHKDNPILSKIEDLRESDIMRVLNASYIAERFFGKSKNWFSQKLNNPKGCALESECAYIYHKKIFNHVNEIKPIKNKQS